METKAILKSIYESNIKTWKMLINLVNKWQDKSYDLTDEEWDTIKHYKTSLDLHFNDVSIIQETIIKTENKILELN